MPRAATKDVEGQMTAFPELGNSEAHKELLRAAISFDKAKKARAETLGTMKEKQDAAEQKLIGLMHENKLTCFKHDGIRVEIMDAGEKAIVKSEEESDDETDDAE